MGVEQGGGEKVEVKLPSSAEEGWLRGLREYREATLARADGVVLVNNRTDSLDQHHPVRSVQRWLRDIFLDVASTPPLLRRGALFSYTVLLYCSPTYSATPVLRPFVLPTLFHLHSLLCSSTPLRLVYNWH